ncbi:MAG: hypothetical protein FWF08_02645 [Oscillospiraceae bacterium]|nr:hypothetical protein [Oscillospiraceae bacterium]
MPEGKISRAGFGLSLVQKITAVLMGGLIMGAMWRVRGDDGFGSFWGMLPCGIVLCLFIFTLFGYRKKFSYEILPWIVISIPFTINGWMPVMPLLKGVIEVPNLMPDVRIEENFSYLSAVFLIFCVGFGWMAFFGFFMGVFFSDKKYRFMDFVFCAVVFLAIKYAFNLFFSHLIMYAAAPQSIDAFTRGLLNPGSADIPIITESPMKFYIMNFFNSSIQKKYVGGRTYFNRVSVISQTFGALGVSGMLLFRHRDKKAAKIMLSVCAIVACSFIGGALINVLACDGFRGAWDSSVLPNFFMTNYWGFVEYSVGFFIGIGVTAYLVSQKRGLLNANIDLKDGFPDISKNKYLHFVYHLLTTVGFMLLVSATRPIASRLNHSPYCGEVPNMLTQACTVGPALLVFGLILWKNIVKKGLKQPFSLDFQRFAMYAGIAMFTVFCIIDIFVGWPFWKRMQTMPLTVLVGGSWGTVMVCYLFMGKKMISTKSGA